MNLFNDNTKGAVISECEKYRYQLWRIWDKNKPKVMFIMINPSKADANKDDNTVKRCIGFAKSWGYGGLYIGNLFAYRSTDVSVLKQIKNPVGESNFFHLREMAKKCDKIICAWGNGIKNIPDYIAELNSDLYCIELSKNGFPKHPLFLRKNLTPKLLRIT